MSHQLFQTYRAFTSKVWQQTPAALSDPRQTLGFISSLSDPNHSVLLRALLDREHQYRQEVPGLEAVANLSAGPKAYALAQDRLDWVKEENTLKFFEFRDKWRKRLAFVQLHPFLQRNQWFVKNDGGTTLLGKGTRKDSKMLYLQTLHDMASDAERQVSSITGHLFRMQTEVSAVWHQESVTDDRSRLLPVLEEALRAGEAEMCKRVRLSIGDLASETFIDRVGKWDKRSYATEAELFRQIAWPWYHSRYTSGFEGFMESFADLVEAISNSIISHYQGKWDLFLRGLAPLADRASQISSGESIHV